MQEDVKYLELFDLPLQLVLVLLFQSRVELALMELNEQQNERYVNRPEQT